MTELQPSLFDGQPPVLPSPLSRHRLYRLWETMKQRCGNTNALNFKNYGGRGIYVADEWRNSARAFVAWALVNGWQSGLQLDRRDNDGPYSPANCRFVTRRDNCRNRRNTVRLSDGRPALPVAASNGVKRATFGARLSRGWTPDQAAGISLPPARRLRFRLSDGTPLADAIRASGRLQVTVYARLHRGWSPDDAVSVPKGGKRPSATVRVALGESEASAQGDKAQRPAALPLAGAAKPKGRKP